MRKRRRRHLRRIRPRRRRRSRRSPRQRRRCQRSRSRQPVSPPEIIVPALRRAPPPFLPNKFTLGRPARRRRLQTPLSPNKSPKFRFVDSTRPSTCTAAGLVAPASWQSPAFDVLATTKSPAVVAPSNEHGTYPRYVITAFPLVPDPLLTIPITPSVSAVPAFTAQDGVAALYFARKFSDVPVVRVVAHLKIQPPRRQRIERSRRINRLRSQRRRSQVDQIVRKRFQRTRRVDPPPYARSNPKPNPALRSRPGILIPHHKVSIGRIPAQSRAFVVRRVRIGPINMQRLRDSSR